MGRNKGILPFAIYQEFLLSTFCIFILCGTCYGHHCFRNPVIDNTGPVVVTKTGTIVGTHVNVFDLEIPTFLGIPFAKPPVGERRFRLAEPVEYWNGTLFAKEKSAECMQYFTGDAGEVKFSEDCLYLNVWLPPGCCCDRFYKLPVMVWVNGGGYYTGSEIVDPFAGDLLAAFGEVIVVSFNYRLGVFGFLNIDAMEAPGNMGLYDQFLALQWIRENIYYFGGDPNRVTLIGENAGALSVSLQMMSPISGKLFHKAILVGGTAFQPFKVYDFNEARITALKFFEHVGCPHHSIYRSFIRYDILKCLMSLTADELVLAENYLNLKYHFFTATYGSLCEGCFTYFTDSPLAFAQSGVFTQIPTLIGYSVEPGTLFMTHTIPRIFRWDNKQHLTLPVARRLLHEFFHNILKFRQIRAEISADKVLEYYTKNIAIGSHNPLHLITRIYNDFVTNCGIMYFADHIKDVYFYLHYHHSHIDYDDLPSFGVRHLFESPYVFGDPIRNAEKYDIEDIHLSADIIGKWSSFAYDGYPFFEDNELEWPKYSFSDRKVFLLHSNGHRVVDFEPAKACDEFWRPYFEHSVMKPIL